MDNWTCSPFLFRATEPYSIFSTMYYCRDDAISGLNAQFCKQFMLIIVRRLSREALSPPTLHRYVHNMRIQAVFLLSDIICPKAKNSGLRNSEKREGDRGKKRETDGCQRKEKDRQLTKKRERCQRKKRDRQLTKKRERQTADKGKKKTNS